MEIDDSDERPIARPASKLDLEEPLNQANQDDDDEGEEEDEVSYLRFTFF